jgi:hypothetical protein
METQTLTYLSEYIFPIVKVKNENGEKTIIKFHGTGFFIGTNGYFLSARHVVSVEDINSLNQEEEIGIYVRPPQEFFTGTLVFYPIMYIENEPNNLDASISKINANPNKGLTINNGSEVYGWTDLYTFGYPDSIVTNYIETEYKFNFTPIYLKGYVVKKLKKGERIGPILAPPGYCISYPIPLGISGSPVFTIDNNTVSSLVGLCLGSYDSSTSVWENSEFESPTKFFKEKVVKVVEYGIVLSIIALKNWKVKIAGNTELEKLF